MSKFISLGSVYLKLNEQNKVRAKPQLGKSLEGGMPMSQLALKKELFTQTDVSTRITKA